jgi:YVTN family beta-propeller protein
MVLASRDGEALTVPGDSVVAIEAGGGRAGAPVDVGAAPSHIAVDGDAVWVGGASDGTVRRIDPSRRAVVQTIPLGSAPDGIAAAEDSVWVTSALEGVLVRISPRTNTIVQTIRLADGPRGVAVGEGAVWVAGLHGKTLTRVAPATGRRTWTRSIGGSPLGVTTTEGAVWVTNETDASVSRIDPRTGRVVQTIGVGNGPGAIAATADAVWVANTLDATVSRIDPGRNAVTATVPVGAEPASLAAGDGGVWVANELAGTVERIDPRTNAVAETIRTGNRPSGLAHDGRRLWLATRDAAAAHRGGTLRASGSLTDIDPSVSFEFELDLTGAGLTGYRRVGGAAGATLLPDLAVGLPTPGDGGRTYTFQLRTGVRYANGAPLRPADFRRALERFFRLGPVADIPFYDAIDGAAACRARRATCDLSRGIVADDRANTVTFHLTRPDPNLLFSLAVSFAHPVAPGAPPRPVTDRGLPGVGPYVIADRRASGEVRFVRNPHFREWGGATRDGYPDEILLVPGGDVVAAVGDDRLDVGRLTFDLDRAALDALAARHPDRLRVTPAPLTLLVALNTTRAPFDDVNARRALALALDRDAMVDNLGGMRAAVTCQILPPNFPGHRPYCPFTTNPGAGGAWEGPDLDAARALVARSRTAGQAVEVLSEVHFSRQGRYVAGVLRRLGYRATARVLSTDAWLATAYGPRGDALQVGLSGWLIDYPSPSTFFEQLRCGATDPSRFCDPAIDRQMDAALALQTTDPAAANAAWARVDRALTDQAPWIGYATPRFVALLSERAGNFQDHPVWGLLLDQMWVR